MNPQWHFGESQSGEKEGFNASGISMFAGDTIESLTREVIQNSLDAREDKSKPVLVNFDLKVLKPAEAPEIYALKEWIDLGQQTETSQAMNSNVGIDFYAAAQKSLKNPDGLKVLAIHDGNTNGLGGPLRTTRDSKDGGWISLVKSAGITNKQADDALGSFGQGAKAPFAMSGLRTVFYYTKTNENTAQQERFQGKCILQSMWTSATIFTGKAGFYGDLEPDHHCNALTGAAVPGWAKQSRESFVSGNGTSLFVVAPAESKNDGDFWLSIKIAVLANFYFAISESNLEVSFGDNQNLTKESLSTVFNALVVEQPEKMREFSEEVQDALESSRTILVGASDTELNGVEVSKTFGEYKWYLRYGEGLTRRTVGVARQNGMLITRSAEKLKLFPTMRPFDLFICVTGQVGSQILRSFENPEHNTFQFKRVVDPDERVKSKRAYEAFAMEIRAFLNARVATEIKSEFKTDDLNHLFGGDLEADNGETRDEKSIRVKLGVAKKRQVIAGEKTLIENGEQENAGGIAGGTGTIENPGGNIPNEDGHGTKAKTSYTGTQVKNLRVTAVDSQGFIKVHFTPTSQGNGFLQLFKSGTSDREPMLVQMPKSDKWISEIPFKDASGGARKTLKIRINADDLKFAIEGVLTSGN